MSLINTESGVLDDSFSTAVSSRQSTPIRVTGLAASTTHDTFMTPNGARKQRYRYSVEIRVSGISGGSLALQITYTDASGGAQTLVVPLFNPTGGATVTSVVANGEYLTVSPIDFLANPNTVVTLKTVVVPTLTYALSFTREHVSTE